MTQNKVVPEATEAEAKEAVESLLEEIAIATGSGNPCDARVKGFRMSAELQLGARKILETFRSRKFHDATTGARLVIGILNGNQRQFLCDLDQNVFVEQFEILNRSLAPHLMKWLAQKREIFLVAAFFAQNNKCARSLAVAIERRLSLEKAIETALAEHANGQINVRPAMVPDSEGQPETPPAEHEKVADDMVRRLEEMF